MEKLFRGTGNSQSDNKNVGTWYTNLKTEAEWYGVNIEERDVALYSGFMTIDRSELEEYLEEFLSSLDSEEREYQELTKKYQQEQTDQVWACNDAIARGYKGLIIENIDGECGETCNYIIIFNEEEVK